jgi:hypothetical protein
MKTKSQSRGGKGVKPIGLAGSTPEVDLAREVGKSGQVGKRNKERASERGTGNVTSFFCSSFLHRESHRSHRYNNKQNNNKGEQNLSHLTSTEYHMYMYGR